MKYRIKHLIEYGVLRAFGVLTNALPHRLALAVAWLVAVLGYAISRSAMRRTQRRIRQVLGPDVSDSEVRRIAWVAWRNLCFNGAEAMRIPSLTVGWVKKMVEHSDIHLVHENMKDGRGLILAVPHMGNWELAGVGMQLVGLSIMIIVRKQSNPLTDAYLNRMRKYTGVEAFVRGPHALSGVIRGLKQGKVLAILPDVHAKVNFMPVRFLGGQAQTPAGMALFARVAGVPIIPASVRRIGWTRHELKGFPPIWPDPSLDEKADWQRMTQYVMDCFDRAVREHPEQYFWFNKRWVLGQEK